MKKFLALAAVAGAVLFIVRRSRSAKVEADVWREATAPTDK
ncbi:MAG TPA: DLW-39 family protein [Pseudonocardiaceae bacterium]|nr:DLW-39 family protein [Pseudonocardiaceae bacterium]